MIARRWTSPKHRLVWLAAAPAGMALIATLVGLRSSGPNAAPPSPRESVRSAGPRPPLEISPDPVVLGTISAHQPATTSIRVKNLRTVPVILERIETSCPCITLGDIPAHLEPDAPTDLRVAFDPSYEPDFVGALAVSVVGYLADGEVGFRTMVKLEVARGSGGGRN